MKGWFAANKKPDEDQPCIVATDNDGTVQTYPISAAWDGTEWVDANGDIVGCVVYWQYMPAFSNYDKVIAKLYECAERDTCEKQDCYCFPMQAEIRALLEYVKELGGQK